MADIGTTRHHRPTRATYVRRATTRTTARKTTTSCSDQQTKGEVNAKEERVRAGEDQLLRGAHAGNGVRQRGKTKRKEKVGRFTSMMRESTGEITKRKTGESDKMKPKSRVGGGGKAASLFVELQDRPVRQFDLKRGGSC